MLQALLFSLLLATPGLSRSDCEVHPAISFPIQNVTLGGESVKRGVEANVGSPSQTMCLDILGDWNNTILWSNTNAQCSAGTSAALCAWYRGGLYRDTVSRSWDPATQTEVEFSPPIILNESTTWWGTDRFRFKMTTLPKLPIFTPVTTGETSGIGLGRNSTVLNYLFTNGLIPSRTWSMFYGWEGAEAEHQLDGNLVLGGYDKAKITGPNSTHSITTDTDCSTNLIIEVADISVDMPNGTTTSVMTPRKIPSFQACLNPTGRVIAVPNNVWEAFSSLAGGDFIAESRSIIWGKNYMAGGVFSGNLTIKLSTGVNITVPNHQLVRPEILVDDAGKRYITNDTIREIYMTNGSSRPWVFGSPFFSAIQLHVNDEEGKFTLWQANPTSKEDLVAVVDKTATTTCTPNSTDPRTSPTQRPQKSKGRSNNVVAIGASIGVVAIFVILGGIIYTFYYRRRHAHQPIRGDSAIALDSETTFPTDDLVKNPLHEADAETGVSMLPSGQGNHHELPSEHQIWHELPAR
ncbi:MAG: hypothetical protein M1816_004429 [Peltula sp. TS41687]|nr:MAG: hypothetical protein M1816_004429 [Peltula sp. TS41687]